MRSLRSAWLSLVGLAVVLGPLSFFYLRPAAGFQDPSAARIIVFHLPMAWLAVIWFIVAAVYATRHLLSRSLEDDDASAAATEMGLICCALATVTGSIFAHTEWGSWWNWDPRETSIFFLLLIYGAYFSLRGSVEDPTRRGLFAAVYALLAGLVMPFLIFVMPRIYPSLHPERARMAGSYWMVLFTCLGGFLVVQIGIFGLRRKAGANRLAEDELASAPAIRPTMMRPTGVSKD